VKLGGLGGGLVEPNSPEMEIASNKTTKVGPKFKTTTPKVRMANQQTQFRVMEILSIIIQEEAHLVYVKLGGHGGGFMKPTVQKWRLLVTSWPKIRGNNSQS
jgi:hypothetical protein